MSGGHLRFQCLAERSMLIRNISKNEFAWQVVYNDNNMLAAFITVLFLAAILVLSEILWKKVKVHPELARKFVHITCGVFIAFLPFWVDYTWIMILSAGFVGVNLLNHKFKIFHAIRAVRRQSWGDVLFGVGVFAVAWFEPAPWLFAMSLLMVSLADGLAAISGVTYGEKHGKYYLFTQPKTIVGSVTFVLTAVVILVVGILADSYFADPLQLWPLIAMLPLLLVCIENLAVFGLDNLALPLVTLGILSLL